MASTEPHSPISGSVLYGVWLECGLIYVGQTGEAQRRLRDLPIGESHHLANTFPPEIWSRVAVVEWTQLTGADTAMEALAEPLIGLALEHRLQAALLPLANTARRTAGGDWRKVDWNASRSRGAKAAMEIDELYSAVWKAWQVMEGWLPGTDKSLPLACHVVFPGDLI